MILGTEMRLVSLEVGNEILSFKFRRIKTSRDYETKFAIPSHITY